MTPAPKSVQVSRTAVGAVDPSSTAALELRGVSKRFPRAPGPVLEEVDLRLQPGEAVLVGGRNGAGKTTLLRLASGLLAPDGGTITVHGLSPEKDRLEYQKRIGFLSAGTSGLYARLSVRQHLDYWARLAFVPRDVRDPRIEDALDLFELRDLARRRVDRMSMGQRQRVRIAMAFLHRPSVILLDEPASSLDAEGSARLASAMEEATSRGAAVLCCSPNQGPPGCGFDRLLSVDDGRLVPS